MDYSAGGLTMWISFSSHISLSSTIVAITTVLWLYWIIKSLFFNTQSLIIISSSIIVVEVAVVVVAVMLSRVMLAINNPYQVLLSLLDAYSI
jgi:hypothetical protein